MTNDNVPAPPEQDGPNPEGDSMDTKRPRGWAERMLDMVEWLGNRLPDPAALFVIALLVTWVVSAILAPLEFTEDDPRTKRVTAAGVVEADKIRVKSQITGTALVQFLTRLVKNFTEFPPLGLVLVALLGVGVAEHTGFLFAGVKGLLSITPPHLLTPMVMLVAILSHSAGDSGFVLVIPLGGVIFYSAGRHPLAGIAVAFAGVAGGLSASFLPSGLDPLLQGFTQSAAQILDPNRQVNPLCNWGFTTASAGLIMILGWQITDRFVEPRLRGVTVDGDPNDMPKLQSLSSAEKNGLLWGGITMATMVLGLVLAAAPLDSPWRKDGSLTAVGAPLMDAIIPLVFLLFLFPSTVYGYVAGTVRGHRDIVQGMAKAMSTMGYYLVMAFFAAQFTYAFRESNLGALIAIKGANQLQAWQLPHTWTIMGLILFTCMVNLLIGSASAKWALLGPIFVPMFMAVGIAPELTQAGFRIGDSTTNVITPLLPYFPLIVVYCQRYVKNAGVGTVAAMMIPYSISFLICWSLLLMGYWRLGLPLGLQSSYIYP